MNLSSHEQIIRKLTLKHQYEGENFVYFLCFISCDLFALT